MLTPKMGRIDRPLAINLLYHLKEEFADLADIADWCDLKSDKISDDHLGGRSDKQESDASIAENSSLLTLFDLTK